MTLSVCIHFRVTGLILCSVKSVFYKHAMAYFVTISHYVQMKNVDKNKMVIVIIYLKVYTEDRARST